MIFRDTIFASLFHFPFTKKTTFFSCKIKVRSKITYTWNREKRKKSRTSRVFFSFKNVSNSQDMQGTRFDARAIIDSETESFPEEPFHEYFAQCRYHSSHFVHTL